MLEIHLNVTVSCPDLVAAAKLLKGVAPEAVPAPACSVTTAPIQQPVTAPTPVQQVVTPPPVTTTAPMTVPLAQAPTFTQADIAKAGADLFTARPDLQPQVLALLAQYGCQSVMDLKPDQFGPFATALRGMGAKL